MQSIVGCNRQEKVARVYTISLGRTDLSSMVQESMDGTYCRGVTRARPKASDPRQVEKASGPLRHVGMLRGALELWFGPNPGGKIS